MANEASSAKDEGRLTIKDWAEDDRPREKLMRQGAGALSDAELLAILIRTGNASENAVDLSKRVLHAVDKDLDRLGRSTVAELMRFKGMGRTKAITVVAALELGRRRKVADAQQRPLVATSHMVFELMGGLIGELQHEEFWLLLLDRGNRLVDRCRVSMGGMHGTVADPKVIFKTALDRRASGLVLCHNHPSGQLRPSEEDIKLTRKLMEGARLLDITVMDHVIITATGHFSFADNGML